MESYEKKYKNALEWARQVINGETGFIRKEVEDIFPELKENEDERIRKELKRAIAVALDYSYFDKETADNILAWLEKQKTSEEAIQYLKENHSPSEVSDFQAAMNIAVAKAYDKGVKDGLEKQGNANKAFYEIAEKEKFDFVSGQFIECRKSFNEFKENNSYWLEYIGNDTYIGRSDNILNQKFHITPKQLYRLFTQEHFYKEDNTNEETKFHEGEWIVNRNGGLWKIKKIFKNTYDIESLYGESLQPIKTVDMDCHLWTIKDAKPGDILSNGKMIVIFKEFEEPSYREHIIAYIGLDGIGAIQVTDGTWQLGADKAHPATKEQRDILEKAMADAGWEFDFEKKELKKIENEIEVPFSVKDSELKEEIYYIPKGFYAEIDDDKVVIKKGKKPTAWSEEDENNLNGVITELEANKSEAPEYDYKTYDKFIDWLKFLKERCTWKPSDEQMDALEHFVRSIGESGYASPYDANLKLVHSLLNDLKKLK